MSRSAGANKFNQDKPSPSLCSGVSSGSKCKVIVGGQKGVIKEFRGIFVMQLVLGQKKNVRKTHVRWMVRYAPSVLA